MRNKTPPPPRSGLRRVKRPLAIAALAIALLAVLSWALVRRAPTPTPTPTRASAQVHAQETQGFSHGFFAPLQSAKLPLPDERARRRRALVSNYQLADHTYCSYRATTQYPFGSRPIAGNGDQNKPNAPVTEMRPMHLDDGGADSAVQMQTAQSRIYMAANESAAFSVRAVDAGGQTLPLVITRALAQGITYNGARASSQLSVPFLDDGSGADPVAGDGAFAGVLAPGQTGLAGFAGTIRTQVDYSVDGKHGSLFFDVIYTPELPATWAGAPREVVDKGSLDFVLPAQVRMPGRYVVSGRVDDARGRPFALLTFNDVLGPGPNEVKLVMFGKLMRDQDAALPLTLRDVDGYLLKENADPDRAMMPRLEGAVYTSKSSSLDSFSDAEWQSEERTRYLTQFSKDVTNARNALARFEPFQALPASECGEKAGTSVK